MALVIAIITIALKLPRSPRKLIERAKAIILAMTGNSYFPSPTPTLADVTAAVTALDAATTAASGKAPGTVEARKAKQRALTQLLWHLADYVKGIAELQAENAAAIVTSASMYLVSRTLHPKAEFAAFCGDVSGAVLLMARAGKGRATHYWQVSTDQKNWTSAPDTDSAQTTITGLTPGQTYYFRHASMRKNVRSDWSQIVSLLVK